ncbi:hypothetical protein [uncultured Tateyamaria sp.]|uniref:hypothetical protein n=1 Tax=uncultured Tateyamaria sp. TaxID=455651 RepID=UPI002618D311|nr:hypothetical protein [uncultured Tateyamaria sp.]
MTLSYKWCASSPGYPVRSKGSGAILNVIALWFLIWAAAVAMHLVGRTGGVM